MGEALDRAFRAAARAVGRMATMLVRRKIVRGELAAALSELREAAVEIEEMRP